MNLPEETPSDTDPDTCAKSPSRGWRYLANGMGFLCVQFLIAGAIAVLVELGTMRSSEVAQLIWLGFMLTPIISGVLLGCASMRLASSARGSSTWLVVAAAAAFAGLAWAAVTAVIFLKLGR